MDALLSDSGHQFLDCDFNLLRSGIPVEFQFHDAVVPEEQIGVQIRIAPIELVGFVGFPDGRIDGLEVIGKGEIIIYLVLAGTQGSRLEQVDQTGNLHIDDAVLQVFCISGVISFDADKALTVLVIGSSGVS